MRRETTLDLFEALGDGFEQVVCATYDITPAFLESYLLRHVPAFADADRVTVLADARRINAAYASHPSPQANRRYILHPIHRAPGCFHAKFIVCVGRDRAVAVVGSANLTESGWMRNLELVDLFETTPRAPGSDRGVIAALLEFARGLLRENPNRAVAGCLDEIATIAPWIQPSEASETLLFSGSTRGLLDDLTEIVGDETVTQVDIMSPYYDRAATLLDGIAAAFKPDAVRLFVPERKGVPTGLDKWSSERGIEIEGYVAEVKGEHDRFLHAKAVSILCAKREFFTFGSANATCAGLLRSDDCNQEIVIVRSGPRRKRSAVEELLREVAALRKVSLRELPVAELRSDPEAPTYTHQLVEAEREGDRVAVVFRGSAPQHMQLRLTAPDGQTICVTGTAQDEGWRSDRIPDAAALFRTSVRACAVSADGKQISNELFVLNLIDGSDPSTLVSRMVHKAKANPLALELALEQVLSLGDQQALIEFFWFLNIPGVPTHSGYVSRSSRTPCEYVPKQPLDLSSQVTLDQALKRFWRRHLRRLERIAQDPCMDDMPRALHLVAALHTALDVQLSQVVVQITDHMTNQAWWDIRRITDGALGHYLELATLLGELYVGASGKMRKELRRDAGELRRGYDRLLKWKSQLDAAVREGRVRVPGQRSVPAAFFRGDRLLRWPEYRKEVDACVRPMLSMSAA